MEGYLLSEAVTSERNILGKQLIRRNEELSLIYEKIKIQDQGFQLGLLFGGFCGTFQGFQKAFLCNPWERLRDGDGSNILGSQLRILLLEMRESQIRREIFDAKENTSKAEIVQIRWKIQGGGGLVGLLRGVNILVENTDFNLVGFTCWVAVGWGVKNPSKQT